MPLVGRFCDGRIMPIPTVSPARLRLAAIAAVGPLLGACEEYQPAEPIGKTVPVALMLAAVMIGAHVALVRVSTQRLRRPHDGASAGDFDHRNAPPLRYPRATYAATVAPVLVPGLGLALVTCAVVGIGYREPSYSLFGWDEMVVITLTLAAFSAAATMIAAVVASSLVSRAPVRRTIARVVLIVAVVGGLPAGGAGLVLAPAVVLAFQTAPVVDAPAGIVFSTRVPTGPPSP